MSEKYLLALLASVALLSPIRVLAVSLVTEDTGLTGQAPVMLDVPDRDSDSDGVPDDEVLCPDSIPGGLVTVADCPTQVENRVSATGCALAAVINQTLEQEGRESQLILLKASCPAISHWQSHESSRWQD